MNKVLIVGRLTRDPDTNITGSNIKYTRFTVAVSRPFGEDQADFIPVIAWRSQADFIDKYLSKGSLIAVEGRFSSSTYQNQEGQNVTRYEVVADRVQSLESRSQNESRNNIETPLSQASTQVIKFAEENKEDNEATKNADVPWELDL